MKKNLLVLMLGALFASTGAYADDEKSVEEKVINSIVLIDAQKELKEVRDNIQNLNPQETLAREEKAQALLLDEKAVTGIVTERITQQRLMDEANKARVAMIRELKESEKKHKKEFEPLPFESYPTTMDSKMDLTSAPLNYGAPAAGTSMTGDNVFVASVYGSGNHLKSELTLNDIKYIVSEGDEVGGYKVGKISKHGIKLKRDGFEQFFNVSPKVQAITPVMVNTPRVPNVIKPYELK